MKTDMRLENLGNPYYETFVILRSLKRIFRANYKQNKHRNQTHKIFKSKEEVLFKEYNELHTDLKRTIIHFGLENNNIETKKYFKKCLICNNCHIHSTKSVLCNLSTVTKLFHTTNDMIETILPSKKSKSVHVKASFLGFKGSKKLSDKRFLHFFRKQYTSILPENLLQFRLRSSAEQYLHNQTDLKHFMDCVLDCNLTLVKFLISLFHFYSETRERTTIYRIGAKENNRFQIRWTMSLKQPKDEIKKNWLQQEIKNIPLEKIIHKFGLLVNYQVEYSLIRSDETENEPIYTRLILLSCGHQLGFELIDEFLEYFISSNTKMSVCHICRVPIWIMGSYNSLVYRCK